MDRVNGNAGKSKAMKFGYARVSTAGQNLDLQLDALKKEGCDEIFTEKVSGRSSSNRPKLNEMLSKIREGDTVVVWQLDRLGRSLKDLINIIEQISERGANFKTLTGQFRFDTTKDDAVGKLLFHIFAAFAELERNLMQERARAGLEAARARGRKGGRRPKLKSRQKRALLALYNSKEATVSEIAEQFDVAVQTVYNVVYELQGGLKPSAKGNGKGEGASAL